MSEEKLCGCGKSDAWYCTGAHNSNRVCGECGHIHEPLSEGNWWKLLPEFVCPECGSSKDKYELK